MLYDRPNLILAYHGTGKKLRDEVILGKQDLAFSENSHDWLGSGIYFWENSYERAFQWANDHSVNSGNRNGRIKEPAVVGAVISLGYCLDLLDSRYLQILNEAYRGFQMTSSEGSKLPENTVGEDSIVRTLDCAVITYLHASRVKHGLPPFDSVRSVFFEGEPLYPSAGFRRKNHIQLCIINKACIRGFFLPRDTTSPEASQAPDNQISSHDA